MKNYEDEEEREIYEKEVASKFSEIESIFSDNIHLFNRNNQTQAPAIPIQDNHFS